MDEAAREAGFENAEAFASSFEMPAMSEEDAAQIEKETNQMQMAPGIKKSPVYMPRGAYPGDKTEFGTDMLQAQEITPEDNEKHKLDFKYVRQADTYGRRPTEGNTITYRVQEGG